MQNKIEQLRVAIAEQILRASTKNMFWDIAHMSGVSRFCAVLAMKRGLDPELSTACGLLHDVFYMTGHGVENHAINGAKPAREFLESAGFSADEIEIIATAVSRHSDKKLIHEPYDELLKDADVMDHFFHNASVSVAEWEELRHKNLLAEFGLSERR